MVVDPSRPVDPDAVLASYQLIESRLFEPHPDEWGGAFYDGDALIVNSVTRRAPDAAEVMRDLGVPVGVWVRRTSVSIADFDRVSASIAWDDVLRPLVASSGPDYRLVRISVGVRAGADRDLVRRRVDALVERPYAASIPYVLVEGGEPALVGD